MATTNFDAVAATTFTGNLVGNVTGDVTGAVSGNITGDVTGDLTGVLKGTPQAITTAGTINNSAAMVRINSTTARAITWTAPTKVGATYRLFCVAAPSSGTHTVTLTAGTLYWQGTAGSIINFSLAWQAVTVNVTAANEFVISDNVGTVTLS